MTLKIPVVDMSEQVMVELESLGVIRQIKPGHNRLSVEAGESKHQSIYEAEGKFGGHKLITVSINTKLPFKFVYHNDDEDFLILDEPGREPLILTIALVNHVELSQLIKDKNLSPDHFIAIRCSANHPNMSFFTMKKGYAHSENVMKEGDSFPSFYVTESINLDEQIVDFDMYELEVI